ncbi:hypothetical protein [Hydrogenophaga laconesensis]|uniref:Uncharacterized protein n=1 Tax=Hydrogenophaga laconesensis TaxID=1805971 RepID=A0ABU1VFW2_9BURK|nr:hypothetical protein [Hydrogenophaga laconesensis]MDR7096215.1 hypothetical protein [Hydrogenophaga laconesensis]
MSQINQNYGLFMDRMTNVETFGALIFMLVLAFGARQGSCRLSHAALS